MAEWEKYMNLVCKDDIKKDCAVKIGNVSCDGFIDELSVGIFTHFHGDHISQIESCLYRYDAILVHPITFAALTALKPGLARRQQFKPTNFGTEYHTQFETISLLSSNHIPGSCQVLVEHDDKRVLYSGDFNYPDLQITKADYLVLDASHGDPSFDYSTDRNSVMRRMLDEVSKIIGQKKPVLIKTQRGTMQEIIRFFEVSSDDKISGDTPFITDKKDKAILHAIYSEEQDQFRDILEKDGEDSREAFKLITRKQPCVIFSTTLSIDEDESELHTIYVDRYRFGKNHPAVEEFSGGMRFNLSSHASIKNILKYVNEVKPKVVMTDASRSGYAQELANLISEKLEIPAFPRPRKN